MSHPDRIENEKIRTLDNNKIKIVIITARYSEGYYNYKTEFVAVYIPPHKSEYEEEDILQYEVIEETCGVFQEKLCFDLLIELEDLGYVIIER